MHLQMSNPQVAQQPIHPTAPRTVAAIATRSVSPRSILEQAVEWTLLDVISGPLLRRGDFVLFFHKPADGGAPLLQTFVQILGMKASDDSKWVTYAVSDDEESSTMLRVPFHLTRLTGLEMVAHYETSNGRTSPFPSLTLTTLRTVQYTAIDVSVRAPPDSRRDRARGSL
ncbi:hypothetical protein Hypma_015888 [Hypsizygus marmoreus]|uniref:Uncharacterized protein n=1 Tax=Hypsizygus marmoreus TaxID=39966 RepID=A0A369KCJ2_HYPMA|nr:hypothetical protein Hypma_015888 [Hypsizygus marmoreus]